MKKTMWLLLAALLCLPAEAGAQNIPSFEKQTFQFAEKEGQKLMLDLYSPRTSECGPTPCILFMFGGAFARGARDTEYYIPYFDFLVRNGYSVVAIDYRLGLKELNEGKKVGEQEMLGMFIHAVDIAVEDLFDATNYLLGNAAAWGIDPECIVLNGSSAGAVSVLQGEYALCNGIMSSGRLPAGFRYKGVLSFAGAIFTPAGGLQWETRPCPMLLMHGDADLQVPYDNLMLEGAGLYGAAYIARSLDERDYPYHFYSFADYGHEIAGDPMRKFHTDVLAFLTTFVKEQQPYKMRTDLHQIGKPQAKKDFGFEDYVRGNFDR